MIDAAITLTVPPEKKKEVLQTFKSILGPIRREQGCISCNCYMDIETESTIFFKEVWQSSDALGTHLRCAHFSVLTGVMKLLDNKPEIRFNTIASTAGVEVIKAARK
jgi:quinol monooxygenase YgiN